LRVITEKKRPLKYWAKSRTPRPTPRSAVIIYTAGTDTGVTSHPPPSWERKNYIAKAYHISILVTWRLSLCTAMQSLCWQRTFARNNLHEQHPRRMMASSLFIHPIKPFHAPQRTFRLRLPIKTL